jgi:hypothetical protein
MNAQDHQNSAPTMALNKKGKKGTCFYVHFGFVVYTNNKSIGFILGSWVDTFEKRIVHFIFPHKFLALNLLR